MIPTMKHTRFSTLLFLLPLTLLWSCGGRQPQRMDRSPGQYKVLTVTPSSTTLTASFPAALEGVKDIEIRPKIDGYIEKVWIDEGVAVKKGQLLFTIRNPQYEADVRSASAVVATAAANVASAEMKVTKTQPLVNKGIISKYELQDARLTLEAQQATLAQARASLTNAQVNLGYTRVTSPVDGLIGTLPLKQGSYVSTSSAALTTVSDVDKVYAYFSINEKQALGIFEKNKNNNAAERSSSPDITLLLSDGTEYAEKGKIESLSGRVNTMTGSYNVRVGFGNSKGVLRSGASATVRIPTEVTNAIIIPQSATYELQGKKMVYTTDAGNAVKAVEVKVREVPGGKFFVVDQGLHVNDKILLEGVGILPEGTRITPVVTSVDSIK